MASLMIAGHMSPMPQIEAAPAKKASIENRISNNEVALAITNLSLDEEENVEYPFLGDSDNSVEIATRPGMVCRLYMPDLGINVALFNTDKLSLAEQQAYVDAPDSGSWLPLKNMVVIGDHASDGFQSIKDAVPGETMCYLQTGTNVLTFVCAKTGRGQNIVKDLLDENGNSLIKITGYSLLTYTCSDTTGKNIYYAFWTPVINDAMATE